MAVYTRRNQGIIYKWKPTSNTPSNRGIKISSSLTNQLPSDCGIGPDGIPYDQNVQYVHDTRIINGVLYRTPYVACGYVE